MSDHPAPIGPEGELAWRDAKLRALAEFAAGAGHEINNPLATIIGHAQMLLAGETDVDRQQALRTIGAQAYRIRDMIGDVMLFARPPLPVPELVDLTETARGVIGSFAERAGEQGLNLQLQGEPSVPVWADPVQLRVVLECLMRNSFEALSGRAGCITLRCATRRYAESNWGCFTIHDTGPGLCETDREHLFDPFYSGRQAGRGLGFGLCKVWRIVHLHGGQIDVNSTPEGGTTFEIQWPAAQPATDSP